MCRQRAKVTNARLWRLFSRRTSHSDIETIFECGDFHSFVALARKLDKPACWSFTNNGGSL